MKTNTIGLYFAALFVLIFALGTGVITAQTCMPPPVGLVAHYSGDSDALDARSRYNGTLENGATFAAGKVGQGFSFDGGDDQLTILHAPDQNSDRLTIEGWINAPALTHGGTIVQKRTASNVGGYLLEPTPPSGGGAPNGLAFIVQSKGGSYVTLNPANVLTPGVWQHVAATYDGTTMRIYVNGVLVGSQPLVSSIQPVVAPIVIGRNVVNGTGFQGVIDELSIYNRALSATEIQSIHDSGTAGKCKPMATLAPNDQALWLAGDGDGRDLSGSGTNAVLQNGTSFQIGKVGQSFSFDGVDDQITVPHSASQNGGTNLSIEFWMLKSSASFAGETILQKRSASNVGGYVLEYSSNQSMTFSIQIGGTYHSLFGGSNTVPDGVWNHITATYDGTAMRLYRNGLLLTSQPQTGAIDAVTDPIVIGKNLLLGGGFNYHGSLDEIGIYNRALSSTEIQSIYNAARAGKYKIQATVPAAVAAWYSGDGNPNDLTGGNTATLQGGATYTSGKVGQAFSLNGTNAYVQASSTAANDPTGSANGASMEAWIYLNQRPSDAGRQMFIISKTGTAGTDGFDIHIDTDNFFKFVWAGSYTGYPPVAVQTGVWYHVAATFSPTGGTRFYLNGQLQGIGNVFTPRTPSGVPLEIGNSAALGGNKFLTGLIDEPAIYNRTLTPEEIRDQYYVGSAGKYKGAAQRTASAGDVTVTFETLPNAVAVHETQLDPGLLPAFPMGITPQIVYDIATSDGSGNGANPSVCFNSAGFAVPQFNYLRVYHLESGVWQDRTASGNSYPNLCSTALPSLSPVAIAQLPTTAAAASISGRVTSQKGGLGNVSITIVGGDLVLPLTTRTNGFGYYKFDGLAVGQNYVVSASSKQYSFSQPTRLINLLDDISDADFIADILPGRIISIKR